MIFYPIEIGSADFVIFCLGGGGGGCPVRIVLTSVPAPVPGFPSWCGNCFCWAAAEKERCGETWRWCGWQRTHQGSFTYLSIVLAFSLCGSCGFLYVGLVAFFVCVWLYVCLVAFFMCLVVFFMCVSGFVSCGFLYVCLVVFFVCVSGFVCVLWLCVSGFMCVLWLSLCVSCGFLCVCLALCVLWLSLCVLWLSLCTYVCGCL